MTGRSWVHWEDGVAEDGRALVEFLRNEHFAVEVGRGPPPPDRPGATLWVRRGGRGDGVHLTVDREGGVVADEGVALEDGWTSDPAALWSVLHWLARCGVTLGEPERGAVARLEAAAAQEPSSSWRSYEDPAFTGRYRTTWQDREVPATLLALLGETAPDGIVLDLGCGPGFHAEEIARRVRLAVGVDPSRAWITGEGGQEAAIGGRPERVQADGRRLPFRSGAFEGVWCCAVLVHLVPPDRRTVLAEIARVVRPGGRVGLCLAVGKQPAVEEGRLFVPYPSDEAWRAELAAVGLTASRDEVVLQTSTTAGGTRVARWVNVLARREQVPGAPPTGFEPALPA